MSLLFKQLMILLWKCWIIRRRHWCSSIFELLSPVALALLLVYLLRANQPVERSNKWVDPTIYSYPSMAIQFPSHTIKYIHYLYYCPVNNFTDNLMNRVNEILGSSIIIIGLSNASLVNQHLNEHELNITLEKDKEHRDIENENIRKVGVIFDVKKAQQFRLKYTIRMSGPIYDLVHHLFIDKKTSGPAPKESIYEEQFCPLQTIINQAFLDKLMDDNRVNHTRVDRIAAYPYPYPKYKTGSSATMFASEDLIAAVIITGYTIMCAIIVKRITDEKSVKAKEMLRMMGMSDWIFWGSHFINYFTIVLFHDIVFTLLFFVGLGGFPLIGYSDWTLFAVIIALFGAQFILFCMLFTTIFNKPVLAVVVTIIFYIVSYAVLVGSLHPTYTKSEVAPNNYKRLLSSVLPTLSLTWCMAIIGQFESFGTGAKWSNLFTHTLLYTRLTLGSVILVMLFSCLLYCILIWYLDAVWPFQYGVPKPFYFPFMPDYWCQKKSNKSKRSVKDKKDRNNFEEEPNEKMTIQAINLRKEFGGCGTRKIVAVRDVSLNIYKGQITVLLGHNGAGKTTTMNMITGIFPPTSGTVTVNGYDVVTQTNKARKSIGLCPQENVLFNELTVGQHLKLYAILKNYPCSKVNKEVDNTLKVLQLTDKKKTLAPSLSGGMKRKLSLGIAMIGGTKILILDEPTSGMDPEARRAVWDLLQTLRTERTIFLTTHYMEEADVLGDRIAIMSAGLVKCSGAPMFLKKRFGTGYHLRIAKADNYDSNAVQQLLKKYLPDAHLLSEIQSEVIYSLESNKTKGKSDTTAAFPKLFDEIERNKEKLGIASCGVSITTMEDVFLRVGHEDYNDGHDLDKHSSKKKSKSQKSYNKKLNGNNLCKSRFKGLLIKRFHFAKRYIPMMVFLLVIPALLFIALLLLDDSIRSNKIHPTVDLSLDLAQLYGNTKGFIKVSNKTGNSEYEKLTQTYSKTASKHGMKTTILRNENPNEWALKHSDPIENYITTYLIGAEVDSTNDSAVDNIIANPWYNIEATHALPISINMVYESLIKLIFPDKHQQISVSVNNYPIAPNQQFNSLILLLFAFFVSCLIILPITVPFIGASYILFPINERISNSKLLQIMTGLSTFMYWFCNFVFDMMFHLIAVIVMFVIIFIFDFNKIFFGQFDTAIALFLILLLFGFASIPIAYCFSLWFNKPTTGFVVLVIFYLVFGFISLLILGIMNLTHTYFKVDLINTTIFYALIYTFRLVPIFAMCLAVHKIYLLGSFAQMCKDMSTQIVEICATNGNEGSLKLFNGCCKDKCGDRCYDTISPFRFDDYGIGFELLAMLFVGIAAFILLLFLDSNMLRKMFSGSDRKSNYSPPKDEDADVSAERKRIENLRHQKKLKEEAIAAINLTKNFNTMKLTGSKIFTAVDHLTFGIHPKECFGLLGVNGAGKTTTFRMLTGDLPVTDGNAFISNNNLIDNLHNFQKHIGYCPQFDALLDKLTGSEMLYLFSRLRGIPSNKISKQVSDLIKMVDLQEHAHKRTETYSGGNRRKLSLALAIIGNPSVLFLDEPTAGVDPSARRKIWATLTSIQQNYDTSIVLTSHSMEECEALCSRIAIMVNGMFKCFGASQHLRSKFGQGFTLIMKIKRKLNDDEKYMESVVEYIKKELPSAVLKDSHQCLLHYHITDTSVQWSKLFSVMEAAKQKFQLEDYVVSDTTLEQIFLAFAKTQRELLQ